MARVSVDAVFKAIAKEAKQDTWGDAWEGVDVITERSVDEGLALAEVLLRYGLSEALPAERRSSRENILQAGREGWNPANLKIFSMVERISTAFFGNRYFTSSGQARADETKKVLGRRTKGWTDEMLWVFLRSFATHAGSLKARRWVLPLLKEIVPTDPAGPGGMLLNNLRGEKNPRKRPVAKPAAQKKPAVGTAAPSAALVESLRKQADDPAVLAIFADWLTEQAHPAGELMQLELKLAKKRDSKLEAARAAWHRANPEHPCVELTRTKGLPTRATWTFKTGNVDERKAFAAFLARPEVQVLDTLQLFCGRVVPAKFVLEALERCKPLHLTAFEFVSDSVLDLPPAFFSSSTFPRLKRLELHPHRFPRPPRLDLPTLESLVVGVARSNGALALDLRELKSLRSLHLHCHAVEPRLEQRILAGTWELTELGLFAWGRPMPWDRLQAAPVFAALEAVGTCWEQRPTAPRGKRLLDNKLS